MEVISADKLIKLKKEYLYGKLLCFPTDTVYGIGSLYDDEPTIRRIYEMKSRSRTKPLVNLCSDISQITSLVSLPAAAIALINRYWPGALTIILKDAGRRISFRMPDCHPLLKIVNRFGLIASTSVNESGKNELNDFDAIQALFGGQIDYFINDDWPLSFFPSTVIDLSEGGMAVLREGNIKL